MLGKMIIHALVAAILIGSAAAVYAQARDGAVAPVAAQETRKADSGSDGYVRPAAGAEGKQHLGHDERHERRADAKRGHHDRKHGHDEDDDD